LKSLPQWSGLLQTAAFIAKLQEGRFLVDMTIRPCPQKLHQIELFLFFTIAVVLFSKN